MKYSIVKKSQVCEVSTLRFDAEYFSPTALDNDRLIQQGKYKTINELGIKVVSGPFGSSLHSSLYLSKGIPFIRISDLCDFYIDEQNLVYISEWDNNRLKSSQLNIGDLVLSKVGNTIGVVSKISKNIGNSNISENNIGLKFSSTISEDTKNYILTLLNCKNGQIQIFRRLSGNGQPKLNVSDIEELFIPIFDVSLEKLISNLVQLSYQYREKCIQYYKEVNACIQNELSIDCEYLEHKLWSVKKYSDVKDSNRLDAEYFQPKYDEILKTIKDCSNGYDILGNIVSIKKGIEVGSQEYQKNGIPFVRVSNLNKFGINENNQQYISQKTYDRLALEYQPQKGEILLSKDGTAGIAYNLNEIPPQMIISGGILRLTITDSEYLPEYLTLVLNSMLVQQQIERTSSGALIQHWLINEINSTLIPKLDIQKQREIVEKIQESTKCRKQSKQFLEIAKRGVEIAIEQDENIATNWINKELQNIEVEL